MKWTFMVIVLIQSCRQFFYQVQQRLDIFNRHLHEIKRYKFSSQNFLPPPASVLGRYEMTK